MNKYYFIIDGNLLNIVNQKDYEGGYNNSYNIDPELTIELKEFGCHELMEGIYEIDKIGQVILDEI